MNIYQQTILTHIQAEYFVGDEGNMLTIETPLVGEGVVDSMGIYRLVAFLEEEFDIDIEPTDVMLHNFKTIEAIASLAAQKSGN